MAVSGWQELRGPTEALRRLVGKTPNTSASGGTLLWCWLVVVVLWGLTILDLWEGSCGAVILKGSQTEPAGKGEVNANTPGLGRGETQDDGGGARSKARYDPSCPISEHTGPFRSVRVAGNVN